MSQHDQGVNAEIADVLAIVDEATANGFRPIQPTSLPPASFADVRSWRSEILRDPESAEPSFAFHVGSEPNADVVRIERKQNADLVEFQTPLAVSIWVRPEGRVVTAGSIQAEDVTRVAQSLFTHSFAFQPRSPSSRDEGFAVSTAPSKSIYNMPSWLDRVDAGIHKGYLHFIFYKRHSQLMGLGSQRPWFDDIFRGANR